MVFEALLLSQFGQNSYTARKNEKVGSEQEDKDKGLHIAFG